MSGFAHYARRERAFRRRAGMARIPHRALGRPRARLLLWAGCAFLAVWWFCARALMGAAPARVWLAAVDSLGWSLGQTVAR